MSKFTRCCFFVLLLLSYSSLTAQNSYKYAASEAHPFGLPNPEAPPQILDYAPMIGECDCKSTARNPDQTWQAEPVDMIWRFKYIMNGFGVQDETLKADSSHSGSIRQFDQDSAKWFVHYYSNRGVTPVLSAWSGNKKDNGDIVLYKPQKAPNDTEGFYKITFHDISEEGFKWLGEWVNITDTFAYPTWKIDCKKRKNSE